MKLKNVALALAAFAVPGVSIAAAAAPVRPASSLPHVTTGITAPVTGVRKGVSTREESQMVGSSWLLLLLGLGAVGAAAVAASDSNGTDGPVSP